MKVFNTISLPVEPIPLLGYGL